MPSKHPLSPPAAIHSKAVHQVLLLLIHCYCCSHNACGGSVFGPCFIMHYLGSVLFSFAIILMGKRELVAFYFKYILY